MPPIVGPVARRAQGQSRPGGPPRCRCGAGAGHRGSLAAAEDPLRGVDDADDQQHEEQDDQDDHDDQELAELGEEARLLLLVLGREVGGGAV